MEERLNHLRQILKSQNVDAFLVSSKSNIFYLSGFNRFLEDHDGYLLVTQKTAQLITSPLYTHAVKKFSPNLAILEMSPNTWYSQLVKKIATQENLKTIGFEERDLRVSEYFDLEEEKLTLKSVSLRNLREQKNKDEIAATEEACELTDKTFDHILSFVKEGITELQLAEEMQSFLKKQNADIGFPTIVAFGAHSAVPHHMTSDEKLQKNSFVLFDFGVTYDNYLSDMSRTVFFGKPKNEQIQLYETVRKSQEAAIAYIEKNVTEEIFTKDVDALSRKVIENAGFPTYPHALGHGVGLEVHEAPTISLYSPEKLLENMIFTLEPGIYVPEMGGVRIEDVYVLQENKLRQLTKSSKELIVLNQ